MKVTLSEFVVKSLIEEKSIDLLYVQPKFLVQFLAGLKYAAKNYNLSAELKAVLDDESATKFTELYEEICATVASFGGAPMNVNEFEVMERFDSWDEPKLKEFKVPGQMARSYSAPTGLPLYH